MTPASISYQVTPANLSEHIFEVKMNITLAEESALTSLSLTLPAWIPGSYMIRDFARNIVQIECDSDEQVLEKLDKQSWQVSSKNGSPITECEIMYRVFAFDLSVRSAYINHEYAFFNGTSALLNVVGYDALPHYLQILPGPKTANWDIVTAMPIAKHTHHLLKPDQTVYRSENYAELIDHPVLLGQLSKASFEVDGVVFHVVFTGPQTMDLPRICEDLKPICRHHIALFGECPVDEYWFMTLLCDKGFGGLEHKSSTVLQFSRFDLPMLGDPEQKSDNYQQFLSLCSHELFHTWHVKRIKPRVMVNPDLRQETYTPQLWIYEGFTSLYDDLTLARTGIISASEYCRILGESFTRLMRNPGRHLQSIADSSFDAWTRFYKQDASSVNHIVSYYLKGSIVALALDITIRQQTHDKHSLDDVMRHLWQQYGKDESGTLDDVIGDICEQQFGIDIRSFLHVAVASTMDLPLSSMVNSIGLKINMRACESNADKGGKPASHVLSRDIGATFVEETLGLKVVQVLSGGAAALSGVQLNDIIVACGRYKTNITHFSRCLNNTPINSTMVLHILRDNQLIEVLFVAQEAQLNTCYLTIEDESKFTQWLNT
ncbi:M61 family metallopeptidase [Glaciecola sp. SC05]|uniref:M61 family metallopeptidase n=1 Tax=Glaciecola sp. SC05 TaxID=1987355 RepID=UPI0035297880